jgi:hypothetical protein
VIPRDPLPFRFDTSRVVVPVLRIWFGLLLVLVAAAAYTLIVSRRPGAALGLFVVAGIVVYFGRLFVANWTGTRGMVTFEGVTVERVRLFGVRLAGPEGTFPTDQFAGVRVERAPSPLEGPGGPHARVYLAGRDRTPDILVARDDLDEGRALARDLAAALDLPLDETSVPY